MYSSSKRKSQLEANARCVKTWCISSLESFDNATPNIITTCEAENARAYIHLNARSYRKVSFAVLQNVTKLICDGNYKSVKNTFESACGTSRGDGKKSWVVDVDDRTSVGFIEDIIKKITASHVQPEDFFCYCIPTPNGLHLITNPFDVNKFHNECNEHNSGWDGSTYKLSIPDIHKDNPTVLYFKDNN